MAKILPVIIAILAIALVCSADIPQEQAIHALMGECRDENYVSKVYHACALLNRGTLTGVYGVNVPMLKLKKEPESIWEETRLALEEARTNRITDADSWGSIIVDKKWIKKMMNAHYKFCGIEDRTAFFCSNKKQQGKYNKELINVIRN